MSTYDKIFMDALDEAETSSKRRSHPDDEEHRLQRSCVQWFAYAYPELRGCLFAVPNGGRRDRITGARLKAEGVVAGVSDLILLRHDLQGHGALLIEMKTRKGQQSREQLEWQHAVTKDGGYKYTVCRSLDDFRGEVEAYLNGDETKKLTKQ